MEATPNRFSETVSQSINAGNGLASQFPQPSVPPREVIRCQSCSLVQFRTMSDLCRRCRKPFAPKLETDLDDMAAPEISDNSSGFPNDRWRETSTGAPGSYPSQSQRSPEPQIGFAIKRLRKVQGVSQGELGRRVGLRRTYLSRVENDHVMPGPRIVYEIARALGVGIGELFAPQPKRGGNGAALAEPTCSRLVQMFSGLQQSQMAQIVSQARRMCAPGVTH